MWWDKKNKLDDVEIIPKPKYKIGDIVVWGLLQEMISYARWSIKKKSWYYRFVSKENYYKESDIIYKLD